MGAIYGNSYYTIVDGPSWAQAEANAVSLGGHLVTIGNQSEQIFLSNNFISNTVPIIPASSENIANNHWIGLTDKDQEGVFKWISGEDATYTNWALREPNNHNSGEDYVHLMYLDERGKGVWNDAPNGPVSRSWSTYVEKGIAEISLSYFSISDATFREGKGGDVTITRTGSTTTTQTLKVTSSDGTATRSDNDYSAVNTTLTFAAGETSKTINISTTADLNVESDESFTLTMTAEGSDDVPPQITDGSATVTIKADDFKRGNSLYTIVDGPSWTQAET
jgi:hypothetical protein